MMTVFEKGARFADIYALYLILHRSEFKVNYVLVYFSSQTRAYSTWTSPEEHRERTRRTSLL